VSHRPIGKGLAMVARELRHPREDVVDEEVPAPPGRDPEPAGDGEAGDEPAGDDVEEADVESFPASDPPSQWSGGGRPDDGGGRAG
jgi:hypothetical protein